MKSIPSFIPAVNSRNTVLGLLSNQSWIQTHALICPALSDISDGNDFSSGGLSLKAVQ